MRVVGNVSLSDGIDLSLKDIRETDKNPRSSRMFGDT